MRMHYIANAWHMYNVSACVTTGFGAIFDFIRNIGPMRHNVEIVHVRARTFYVLIVGNIAKAAREEAVVFGGGMVRECENRAGRHKTIIRQS
jgi:hypothetical protein